MGKVTFLGVEGSGKTVLAVALVDAFRRLEDSGWFLRPDSRSAYRFQTEQIPRLSKGEFPSQTASLKKLEWTVTLNGKDIRQLNILDYPGELYRLAFLAEADDPDPVEFREKVRAHHEEIYEFLGHLVESDHFFVLFNLDDAEDQDLVAKNLDAMWTTNACLNYLKRLPGKRSITLLLTQADRYPELRGPSAPSVINEKLKLIVKNYPDLNMMPIAAARLGKQDNGIHEILSGILGPLFSNPDEIDRRVARLESAIKREEANQKDLLKAMDALGKIPYYGEFQEYATALLIDAREILSFLNAPSGSSFWGTVKIPRMKTDVGEAGAISKAKALGFPDVKWI